MSSGAGISRSESSRIVILVAEDNLTNQKVLGCQLDALGYRASFAANGREALARWQAQGCSLLLTDCHMPEMDGFELAAAIRRDEQGGTARTPIVAITAVLEGEAENCLRAGMDAYLSKPVSLQRLREVIEYWLPKQALANAPSDSRSPQAGGAGARAPVQSATHPAAGAHPVMDAGALGRLLASDDREVLRPFMLDFLNSGGTTVRELLAAQGSGSAAQMAALAHRLKSSAAAVGAVALSHTCQTLESAGRARDWTRIERLLDDCIRQFHEVSAWIHADA